MNGGLGSAGSLWLIAAVVLGLAELAIPGAFLVFLALSAAITGIATLVLSDLSIGMQLVTFTAWSVVTVLIGKRWYRDYPVASAARLIGQVATVETAIALGYGRVEIGDGTWPARGPDAAVGMRMRIVAIDGGVVMVAPLD